MEKVSKKTVAAASAIGLITVEGQDPAAYFRGGRAMQRAWLVAAIWAIALVANFVLNLYLIPVLGLYGAAMATMASAMLATAATVLFAAGQGFRPDPGVWTACLLPAVLLAGPAIFLPVIAVWAIVAAFTNLYLTTAEKERLLAGLQWRWQWKRCSFSGPIPD